MSGLKTIRQPVAHEIAEFEKHFKKSISSNVRLLNIITNYIIRRKGKQIRPLFVFLTAKMLGEVGKATYTAASLIELLHTASLIHDDVVDESYERRGFFSINALWKSKVAVLIGDYMLAQGLLLSVENKQYELLAIVSEAVKQMSEGELLQIQKSRKLNITEEQYFNIIEKKTASLIAACTACGAQSTAQAEEVIEEMKKMGALIGIAFQIKDDLFDYQKSPAIGKPVGNDIKEKKLTLPLIHALSNAELSEKKAILKIINNKNKTQVNIDRVIDFVRLNHGIEYSIDKMEDYKNQAIAILNKYPENEAQKALIKLVEFVITRNK